MSPATDIGAETRRYAERAVEQARTLHRAITGDLEWSNDFAGDLDDKDDWVGLLNLIALEVYGNAQVRSAQAPDVRSITVVTGIGGPHVEFEIDYQDQVTGRAFWGSDSAEQYGGELPGLFESLAELVTP